MGLRSSRRVKLFSGLNVFFSRRCTSISTGGRGVWNAVVYDGRVSVGISGTVLSCLDQIPTTRRPAAGVRCVDLPNRTIPVRSIKL